MDEGGIEYHRTRLSTWRGSENFDESKQAWLDMFLPDKPAWVFAYGSLLWNPGFKYEESCRAIVYGYHRRFCIFSHVYRGTPRRPGLVFGLVRGGSCWGRIFRVPQALTRQVLGKIWDREMIYRVYQPCGLVAHVDSDRVLCHAFIANPKHEQFADPMSLSRTARVIAEAAGKSGSNFDYLDDMLKNLAELGLQDVKLQKLHLAVRHIRGQ